MISMIRFVLLCFTVHRNSNVSVFTAQAFQGIRRLGYNKCNERQSYKKKLFQANTLRQVTLSNGFGNIFDPVLEIQNSLTLDDDTAKLGLNLSEVNVLYGRRTQLVYDEGQERFINLNYVNKNDLPIKSDLKWNRYNNPLYNFIQRSIVPRLKVSFLPSGVSPNYYSFTRWRILQRFVNANLHVFGTQSLLLGLGIKANMSSKLGALSAALNWVLKDALGKIVRMFWASKMGLRFDSDAKRWRFRSAFVFAAGNGLEIATYIFPHMFLVWATLANCCKQISTLTSSSTRSSIFNSFRDGSRENIADITAKGEAQNSNC